ncbi:MAG TPA: biliverdin-producing heme oxygenase [Actinomycetota bacterium]|nr:biliverdin-producing heme oxygenase [Actinomycetota bacterium]
MPHHGADPEDAGRPPLSRLLFSESSVEHREAERRPFQVAFLKAELPRDAYAAYLGQLALIYERLEAIDDALADDATVGAMHSPELHRSAAIDADMRYFAGDDWRSQVDAMPATFAYLDRLEWARAQMPVAYVAHQWLRYLGNVLAAPVMQRVMRAAYDLDSDDGMRFYVFEQIPDARAYLTAYHERLNGLPLGGVAARALVAEGKYAFGLQIRLVDELGARFGIGPIDPDEAERVLRGLSEDHP